jgi:7-carboxy-7-deazaguanine synthase
LRISISEIYESRQGEGLLTGTPSIFLRTSGCNLRCSFCDTPFTSWEPEGQFMSLDEIVNSIEGFSSRHIVITGGEPMLPRAMTDLTARLKATDRHITIETAGTIYRQVNCDLMSISPKLRNSTPDFERAGEWRTRHEAARLSLPTLSRLIAEFEYQLKFVVAKPSDIDEIQTDVLRHLPAVLPDRVLLMPEGVQGEILQERETWLRPACEDLGFRYCPRMHIEWYGNRRGT